MRRLTRIKLMSPQTMQALSASSPQACRTMRRSTYRRTGSSHAFDAILEGVWKWKGITNSICNRLHPVQLIYTTQGNLEDLRVLEPVILIVQFTASIAGDLEDADTHKSNGFIIISPCHFQLMFICPQPFGLKRHLCNASPPEP